MTAIQWNPVIEDLVTLRVEGKTSTALRPVEELIGAQQLLVLATQLLGAVIDDELPKKVNPAWTWCTNLDRVSEIWPQLAAVFVLQNDNLKFSAALTSDEQAKCIAYAKAKYKPRLII